MHRDNKPKGFFYLDHRTVDGKHGIILDTFATAGNVNDSQPYIARLDATTTGFQFKPKAVGLDAGYFTAPVAESLARREIVSVFGYRRPTKGKNSLRKRDFQYDADKDCYTCSMDNRSFTAPQQGKAIIPTNPTRPIVVLAPFVHSAHRIKKPKG